MIAKAFADRSVSRVTSWTRRLIPVRRSTHRSIIRSFTDPSRAICTKFFIQSSSNDVQGSTAVPCMASAATTDNIDTASDRDSVLLQYVILRKDLWTDMKWPLGSIVAQACHASTAALWLSQHEEFTQTYCKPENLDHMHKVCDYFTYIYSIVENERALLQCFSDRNTLNIKHIYR